MTAYSIEMTRLCKRFGAQSVLDGIHLRAAKGTALALLGPNGAGKTTLIHILSTLFPPDGGTARIEGHDVVSARDEVRRSISLTGQFAAVDEVLTGRENMMMMARLSGLSAAQAREKTAELLERFELTNAAHKRVGTYSGALHADTPSINTGIQ